LELLETIAGTVALSIENARVSAELNKAYREVSSMNRAKDKVISHLSHELRTPVAVLSGSLRILAGSLAQAPDERWKPILQMAQRNLDRITEIQYEAQDIMEGREDKVQVLLSLILEQCADELATLFALETGDGSIVEKVRGKILEIFGAKQAVPTVLSLDGTVSERLRLIGPSFSHRKVEILTRIEPTPPVLLPPDVLEKIVDGLIRNAVENTPDEGRIEVDVRKKGEGSLLVVRDYGIGILEDARKRIFEGFFSTQDTMNYSTRRPFDFGAGGKGADLLRMKIFAERHHFQIDMASVRCRHIPGESDLCPGRISKCRFCTRVEDCHESGGTVFTVYFPPAPA
jgi:signal transduction histidine kinase